MKEVMKVNEVTWSLTPRDWCPQRKKRDIRAQPMSDAVCKPRREASGETSPATLPLLDFWPPAGEVMQHAVCSLSLPLVVA